MRIETPSERDEGSVGAKSRCEINKNSTAWDELSIDDLKLDFIGSESRSAPASPVRSKSSVGWKDTITIPQPFQMTVRYWVFIAFGCTIKKCF